MEKRQTRFFFALAAGVLGFIVVATTLAIVLTGSSGGGGGTRAQTQGCQMPKFQGTRVDVSLLDNSMGPIKDPIKAGASMAIGVSPSSAGAGEIDFVVSNTGMMMHELVVMPLLPGQVAGQRALGIGGTVDETGNLGEVGVGCGTGAGDGIPPGGVGWLTVQLPAGRYELICNLPGHYQAGMYTVLTVR